jgi:hypothetical protein
MARHILPTRAWKMQARAVAHVEIKRRSRKRRVIKRGSRSSRSNVARVALFEE